MTAQGEVSFTTRGEAKKFVRPPIPPGDYKGVFHSRGAEISKKPEPGKMPFIKGLYMNAAGTGKKGDGSDDGRVYWLCFLSLKPRKNGDKAPEMADGLRGLCQGLGVHLPVMTPDNGWIVTVRDADKEDGSPGDLVYCLDPKKVKDFLVEQDGRPIQFRTKNEKGQDGVSMEPKVAYFLPSEEQPAEEGEGEQEWTPPEEEEVTEQEAAEETEEVEEEPPPPPKKSAPKPAAQKAPAKAGGKKK